MATEQQRKYCPLRPVWSGPEGQRFIEYYDCCVDDACAWWVKWEPGLAAPGACAVKHLALREE